MWVPLRGVFRAVSEASSGRSVAAFVIRVVEWLSVDSRWFLGWVRSLTPSSNLVQSKPPTQSVFASNAELLFR